MDLIFSRSNTLLSKLIRFFDKGKWSHVAIQIDENTILDSRFPRGVQQRPFDLIVYEKITIEGDIDDAMAHIGKKYDLLRFVWYGIKFGDKPWNNPNDFLCSELISVAAKDQNIKGMTPNRMYRYLKRTL